MVTATGIYSIPISLVASTIAHSSTFQTWTTTANEAAALARVHKYRLADPFSATLPYAVVGYNSFSRNDDINAGAVMMSDAVLGVKFRNTSTLGAVDAIDTLMNNIGAIQVEMEAVRRTASYLGITGIELDGGGPQHFPLDSVEGQQFGVHSEAMLLVSFEGI